MIKSRTTVQMSIYLEDCHWKLFEQEKDLLVQEDDDKFHSLIKEVEEKIQNSGGETEAEEVDYSGEEDDSGEELSSK
jgi:hypothetical protein